QRIGCAFLAAAERYRGRSFRLRAAPASGEIQINVGSARVDGNCLKANRRIVIVYARAAVEFPRVPRAHEHGAVESTISQRAASVRTCSIDRIQLARDIAESITSFAVGGLNDLAGRELREGGHFH